MMPVTEESLFSLELVVDKLYIPHVQCRFPAVAVRLLDFPTIVINHVEPELGKAIRRQISFDPEYTIPNQFSELKDKHGNFMVQKGKSCLFKMLAETLKNHLTNTPLYVMVIDMFPETPKLVGNSTVPLDALIDAIYADIVRLGSSVPSVHGDKGLFKVYNLMGKEIGYFVLGFRLLCLGPSLIPHLPQTALVQRQTKKQMAQRKRENPQLVEIVQVSQQDGNMSGAEEEDSMVETRTWGSMTDPVKHDVMMQTVEMDHKGVHVDFQKSTSQTEDKNIIDVPINCLQPFHSQLNTQHSGTQTDKMKGIKTALNARNKIVNDLAAMEKDEDEVIVTNIVCPPPLFFNSKAKPPIEIDNDSYSFDTDVSASDDVSLKSFSDEEADIRLTQGKEKYKTKQSVFIDRGQIVSPPAPVSYANVPLNSRFNVNGSPQRYSSRGGNLPVQDQVAGLPLLTALISELLSIQSPSVVHLQNVQGMQTNLGMAPLSTQQKTQAERLLAMPIQPKQALETDQMDKPIIDVKVSQINQEEASEKDALDEKDGCGRLRIGHHKCAHPHAHVPKDKSWLRVVPHSGTRKSKLVFGMTNTQRLRLQKTNPQWLRNMEHAELVSKGVKEQALHKHDSADELNVSMSDTLTEVRILAKKELERPTAEDALAPSINTAASANLSKRERSMNRGKAKSSRKRNHSADKWQTSSEKLQSSKQASTERSRQGSSRASMNHVPTGVEKTKVSPSAVIQPAEGDQEDEVQKSIGSLDHPSSAHSRSIEVHMPSVQASHDGVSEISISDSDDEIPLPDESFSQNRNNQHLNFPKYLRQSESLPESIHGLPNESLNTTDIDDDSPLESTRNYHPATRDSRNMSTDDVDTKQTFQSTSEPELQGLNESLDEDQPSEIVAVKKASLKFPMVNPVMSENSPVPSTRRSVAVLDLSRSQMPTTPRAETATPRSSRSGSLKRPTPRPRPHRAPAKDLNTESISSYQPSDPDNPLGSLDSSGEGNYSDDFAEELAKLRVDKARVIPSSKLGYTIH